MASVITVSDVKAEYPVLAASVSDTLIAGFIARIDQADACLDANVTNADLQTSLKLLGVGHLLELTSNTSGVSSERSATGAAVSYKEGSTNGSWSALMALDATGCVTGVLQAGSPSMFFGALEGTTE